MFERSFDTIIVGGGPAGLAAAIWCGDLGLTAILLEERREYGGQLLWTHNEITNYPGYEAIGGPELRDRFERQARRAQGVILCQQSASAIDVAEKRVTTIDGDKIFGRSIIIATGVRRRELGVPGEKEFAGRGMLVSGVGQLDETAGKSVVIVGGGDAAIENAILLSGVAREVTVIVRGDHLRARRDLTERASVCGNVSILMRTSVAAVHGGEQVEAVGIINSATGAPTQVSAEMVLVRIGVNPRSEMITGIVACDAGGYITVDDEQRTSAGGIFAIGDVSRPRSPTLSNATGDAASAANAILRYLV